MTSSGFDKVDLKFKGISVKGPTKLHGPVTLTNTTDDAILLGATSDSNTVTQASTRATGVTINGTHGEITVNGANLGASTAATFTVTNSSITENSIVLLCAVSTGDTITGHVSAVGDGSFDITLFNSDITNISADTPTFRFLVIN